MCINLKILKGPDVVDLKKGEVVGFCEMLDKTSKTTDKTSKTTDKTTKTTDKTSKITKNTKINDKTTKIANKIVDKETSVVNKETPVVNEIMLYKVFFLSSIHLSNNYVTTHVPQ